MPYSQVTVQDVVLLCFPPHDAAFAAYTRRLLEADVGAEPRAIEHALRDVYPRAIVRPRERLAAFGEALWYVYRDGRYSPFSRARWWLDAAVPRLVLAPDGRYVDANQAALDLFGVDLATVRASRSGDFTTPEARAIVPWLLQLLRDTGELHSTSVLRPRDGRPDVPVEYHMAVEPVTGTTTSWFRPVPVDAVEPVAPEPGDPATNTG